MRTESIYDFWSLLKEFEITIPIIQRDYAQGRKSPFVNEIRTKFLLDIYDAIKNNDELNLDFVYGSTRKDNSSDRNIFLPLDGQQRLTTLFLLHWYIAWKEELIYEDFELRKIMSGFKYETRISSKEFCNILVNQNSFKYDKNIEKISGSIKNEAWFFSSWSKDPTILSMLNMLDSIHEIFKDLNNFSTNLFGNSQNIKFRFIELEKFGLDDSLYIKMNARGKLLTPFENFKANLEKKIKELEKDNEIDQGKSREIAIKLDTKWADLFWKYRDDETNVYDKQFLYLLHTLISYHVFTNSENIPEIKLGVEKDDYYVQENYIKYIDKDFIKKLERLLDFFTDNLGEKEAYLKPITVFNDKDTFIDVINNDDMVFSKHIKFYGYCQYILRNKKISKDSFEMWMRIISNLAENQIYNRPSDVQSSIKSVHRLSNYSENILLYFSNSKNKVTGFFKYTIEEERLKANLILKSNLWKKEIFKAENNVYFSGQIIFLLKFANVDSYARLTPISEWTDEKLLEILKDFKSYFEKSSSIFHPEKLLINENLWRRALLTKGDYLLNKRRNSSFVITNFDRDISWKRLLIEDKSKYVKELIDDLTFINIEDELEQIINKYIEHSNEKKWYYYFIKYPELLSQEFCGKNLFVRYISPEEIYLLKTTTTSGRIREYYTSVLYLELKNKLYSEDIQISCEPSPGIKNPNYLELDDSFGKTIFIEFVEGWTYKFSKEENRNKIIYYELVELLKNEEFIKY